MGYTVIFKPATRNHPTKDKSEPLGRFQCLCLNLKKEKQGQRSHQQRGSECLSPPLSEYSGKHRDHRPLVVITISSPALTVKHLSGFLSVTLHAVKLLSLTELLQKI